MKTNHIHIQYHDFHPSQATREFIETTIRNIYEELPRGSTVKVTFSLKDKLVKGMLQVRSYGGPFFSVGVAEDLHEVTMQLISQMRRRLEKFKSKLHKRDSLRRLNRELVSA